MKQRTLELPDNMAVAGLLLSFYDTRERSTRNEYQIRQSHLSAPVLCVKTGINLTIRQIVFAVSANSL